MNNKMLEGDIRNMWRLIKKQVKSANHGIHLRGVCHSNGIKLNCKHKTLELCKKHFGSLAKRKKSCNTDDIIVKENTEVSKETDRKIEWLEITDVVQSLKNNKAESQYRIPQELKKQQKVKKHQKV